MTWETVQLENIPIRIGGRLVIAYLGTPTDIDGMENRISQEPIIPKLLVPNEIRLLTGSGSAPTGTHHKRR